MKRLQSPLLHRTTFCLALALSTVQLIVAGSTPSSAAGTPRPSSRQPERLVLIQANLFADDPAKLLPLINAAQQAGANGIVINDPRVNHWFANKQTNSVWLSRVQSLRDQVRSRNMAFILQTAPTGYGTPLLSHDPNLATGSPIEAAPMIVRNAQLVPEQTANLVNGSFEEVAPNDANRPAGWGQQDEPGKTTVLDRSQFVDGGVSLRIGAGGSQSPAVGGVTGRIFTNATVRPFQQYSLRFFVKTEALTANWLGPYVVDANSQRVLTSQHYSVAAGPARKFIPTPTNWTTDWVEMNIPFNSLNATSVTIGLGAWNQTSGRMWIDNVRIDANPMLNVIRRSDLAISLTSNGRPLREGKDYATVVDPGLGTIAYPGYFDTYHAPPKVSIPTGSTLREGDRVLFSGYHAQLNMSGQVVLSWQSEKVLRLMKRVHQEAAARDLADAYLIDFEEIRAGGWEPADRVAGGSAASLGKHLKRIVSDARQTTRKRIYLWNDMLDPTHNAIGQFFQVKDSLAGVWKYLPSDSVTVINWKSGDMLRTEGAKSVEHFARLGFSQIIAGYYDESTEANHQAWQTAVGRQPRIKGSMYTTWVDDFTKLELFGQLWWK
jgi:hypothetical protein